MLACQIIGCDFEAARHIVAPRDDLALELELCDYHWSMCGTVTPLIEYREVEKIVYVTHAERRNLMRMPANFQALDRRSVWSKCVAPCPGGHTFSITPHYCRLSAGHEAHEPHRWWSKFEKCTWPCVVPVA